MARIVIVLFLVLVGLGVFFFPKSDGSGAVYPGADIYSCKCLGIHKSIYITPVTNYCYGIPYSCQSSKFSNPMPSSNAEPTIAPTTPVVTQNRQVENVSTNSAGATIWTTCTNAPKTVSFSCPAWPKTEMPVTLNIGEYLGFNDPNKIFDLSFTEFNDAIGGNLPNLESWANFIYGNGNNGVILKKTTVSNQPAIEEPPHVVADDPEKHFVTSMYILAKDKKSVYEITVRMKNSDGITIDEAIDILHKVSFSLKQT